MIHHYLIARVLGVTEPGVGLKEEANAAGAVEAEDGRVLAVRVVVGRDVDTIAAVDAAGLDGAVLRDAVEPVCLAAAGCIAASVLCLDELEGGTEECRCYRDDLHDS